MKCDELIVHEPQDGPWGLFNTKTNCTVEEETCYLKSDVDAAIAELKAKLEDAEIARLKDKCFDVKDAAHVLKAFKFYLCQLTHCTYDERTAQWIIDNWEQDYDRVEAYNGLG